MNFGNQRRKLFFLKLPFILTFVGIIASGIIGIGYLMNVIL